MSALAFLLILFIILSIVSVVGIIFLFLTKNSNIKRGVLYFLSVLGMIIAYMNATSNASNYISNQLVAWAFGFLSIAAIILQLVKKTDKTLLISSLLTTASVVFSMVDLFLI